MVMGVDSLIDGMGVIEVKLDFELHKVFLEFRDGYDEDEINQMKILLTGRLLRVMDEFYKDLEELEGVA